MIVLAWYHKISIEVACKLYTFMILAEYVGNLTNFMCKGSDIRLSYALLLRVGYGHLTANPDDTKIEKPTYFSILIRYSLFCI